MAETPCATRPQALLTYYGEVKLPLPGGLVAVLLGIALAAATGLACGLPLNQQSDAFYLLCSYAVSFALVQT